MTLLCLNWSLKMFDENKLRFVDGLVCPGTRRYSKKELDEPAQLRAP